MRSFVHLHNHTEFSMAIAAELIEGRFFDTTHRGVECQAQVSDTEYTFGRIVCRDGRG